jgi:hypothetical protein
MAIQEESKAHSTKKKYFHLGEFYEYSRMKRKKNFGPEHVPYLIYSSQENHGVFLGYLMSSWSSGIRNHTNGDEYETSSIYCSPPQRRID